VGKISAKNAPGNGANAYVPLHAISYELPSSLTATEAEALFEDLRARAKNDANDLGDFEATLNRAIDLSEKGDVTYYNPATGKPKQKFEFSAAKGEVLQTEYFNDKVDEKGNPVILSRYPILLGGFETGHRTLSITTRSRNNASGFGIRRCECVFPRFNFACRSSSLGKYYSCIENVHDAPSPERGKVLPLRRWAILPLYRRTCAVNRSIKLQHLCPVNATPESFSCIKLPFIVEDFCLAQPLLVATGTADKITTGGFDSYIFVYICNLAGC